MKIFEIDRIDWSYWQELLEFFSKFFVETFLQNQRLLLEKRDFDTFELGPHLGLVALRNSTL